MIAVRDLKKSYGAHVAVDGISFEVPDGACFGLLGPNGAGKTTTISIIAGTLDADGGSVAVGGRPMGVSELDTKRLLGYVPQDLAFYEDLSSQDNLRFFGLLFDMGGADLDRAIDAALDVAGLRSRRREPVRQFSGGMKRRLNIAVSLLHDPALLILDEPTVGVDPQSRNSIFEALEALLSLGKTILYTTHYMEEVERLCKSVAIMDHGKVIADGEISRLIETLPNETKIGIESRDEWNVLEAAFPPEWNAVLVGRRLTVTLSDIGEQLPQVLTKIRALATIVRVETDRPSLEQVFLRLTGRSLRD